MDDETRGPTAGEIAAGVAPGPYVPRFAPNDLVPVVDNDLPDGSVDKVLDWVNAYPELREQRAREALEAEYASDDPRTTLVDRLERITEQ